MKNDTINHFCFERVRKLIKRDSEVWQHFYTWGYVNPLLSSPLGLIKLLTLELILAFIVMKVYFEKPLIDADIEYTTSFIVSIARVLTIFLTFSVFSHFPKFINRSDIYILDRKEDYLVDTITILRAMLPLTRLEIFAACFFYIAISIPLVVYLFLLLPIKLELIILTKLSWQHFFTSDIYFFSTYSSMSASTVFLISSFLLTKNWPTDWLYRKTIPLCLLWILALLIWFSSCIIPILFVEHFIFFPLSSGTLMIIAIIAWGISFLIQIYRT